uniref:Tail sheath n=1 Tax=Pseudomonas phage HRDY3 TaxID=3236930 RepID=A0AB39CDU4_9VIRU
MGIAIIKEGFTTAGSVTLEVIDQMLANGFTPIFPVDDGGLYQKPVGADVEKFTVTLEAGGAVDPLNKAEVTVKQPWRINFTVSNNATLGVFVGSAAALPADGSLPYTSDTVTTTSNTGVTKNTRLVGAKGIVGADYTPPRKTKSSTVTIDKDFFADYSEFAPHWNNITEGFINRRNKVWLDIQSVTPPGTGGTVAPEQIPAYPGIEKDVSNTYPLSYYLAITDRGVFLSIWQGSVTDMSGQDFSWLLVQRPVKRDTGVVVTDGKAPVFCVNSVGNKINRFVVRESDVTDASAIISATIDTPDGTAIINEKKQIGVSENNQYIVNYPSRLNTPRYAYTYELDMIGYASATVISGTTEVPQTLYAEQTERTYLGMHSNLPANNGMRIVALKKGAGIA